jgi:bifunctional non-homologous end joining protein LigD
LRAVEIQEKKSRREYVVIDDQTGLVTLIQNGTFEIHPWAARVGAIEQPDRLVFDLDPGPGMAWSAVVAAARDVRDVLKAFKLKSFVRTSGGKGLHVVAPLSGRTTWDELKRFAKHVANELVRIAPGKYIATAAKAKRIKKVFVDYLRNQRGATSIASYSTRARPGAPVATPLAWEELTPRIRADMFRVRQVLKRVCELKHDPWTEFFTIRQSLAAAMHTISEN